MSTFNHIDLNRPREHSHTVSLSGNTVLPGHDAQAAESMQALAERVAGKLVELLLPTLEHTDRAAPVFIEGIVMALYAQLGCPGGPVGDGKVALAQGGLAPWQEKRSRELLEAAVDREVSLADVARACSLSPGHFARAFRKSTGESPHRWLLKRRVVRAQCLLLDTTLPLAEIAIASGFADQSHLTKVFRRFTGSSPRIWRLAHCKEARGRDTA
jgi:AraC family transcriptional regulator